MYFQTRSIHQHHVPSVLIYLVTMASSDNFIQGSVRDYPSTPIPRIFINLLEDHPELRSKSAIIFNELQLTFQDVQNISDDIAEALYPWLEPDIQETSSTTIPKSVGLLVPDNHMRTTSILGIWKAGGAYIPLDSVLPPERIHMIVKETGVKVVLYQTQQRGRMLASLPTDVALINLDTLSPDVRPTRKENSDGSTKCCKRVSFSTRHLAPPSLLNQNLVMCILSTSGSTGEPKFVPIRKNNMLNRLHWYWEDFPFQDDEKGCQKTPPLFVDHLFESFAFLLKGHPIAIIPRNYVKDPEVFLGELSRHQITRLVLVPTLLRNIVSLIGNRRMEFIPPLRMVFSEGEALPPDLATEFLKYFPGSLLINGYGCTETTANVAVEVYRSAQEIDYKSAQGYLSIGKPLANMRVYLLDDKLQPVKDGELGCLYAAGKNVVDGYLKPQEGIFIKNHLSVDERYPLLYNTGDYAFMKNSRLIFQGRRDATVKIRGQRVNLREVEAAIERLPAIKLVLALPYHIGQGVTNIVAFYQCDRSDGIQKSDIYNHCKETLPMFMLPVLVPMDDIPIQPGSGKVDRMKLLAIYRDQLSADTASDEELQSMELPFKLKHIVAAELGLLSSEFSSDDNFFRLGGNSISALAVLTRLRNMGYYVSLSDFFQSQSLREICSYMVNPPCISEGLNAKYDVIDLNQCSNKDEVIRILARGLVEKNPLEIMAGTDLPKTEDFIHSIWPAICKDDVSVVIVDKVDKLPVGAILNLDFRTDVNIYLPHDDILLVEEAVVVPIKAKLLKTEERWLESYLAGCDVTLADHMGPALMEMMEVRVLELARERGYDGVIAVNTHPATVVSPANDETETQISQHCDMLIIEILSPKHIVPTWIKCGLIGSKCSTCHETTKL